MGHDTLRKVAQQVRTEDISTDEMQAFLASFKRCFQNEQRGGAIGLAAPQVNVSKRVLIVEFLGSPPYKINKDLGTTVLINPKVEVAKGTSAELVSHWESCISVPDLWGKVQRPKHVIVSYLDEAGRRRRMQASGMFAALVQHEVDHLNGILFVDRMSRTQIKETLMFTRAFRDYTDATGDTGNVEGEWKFLD